MSEWIRSALDLILIVAVGAGLVQATRLIRHLVELRGMRADMERFVHDFNSTVMRAEAGIKGLRGAARESGDDLEKLVEKAVLVRDELQFITESADQLADRISVSASAIMHAEAKSETRAAEPAEKPAKPPISKTTIKKAEPGANDPIPSSRAEKELLQALRK